MMVRGLKHITVILCYGRHPTVPPFYYEKLKLNLLWPEIELHGTLWQQQVILRQREDLPPTI